MSCIRAAKQQGRKTIINFRLSSLKFEKSKDKGAEVGGAYTNELLKRWKSIGSTRSLVNDEPTTIWSKSTSEPQSDLAIDFVIDPFESCLRTYAPPGDKKYASF